MTDINPSKETGKATSVFHKEVGKILKRLEKQSNFEVLLDKACDGEQYISLFMGKEKNRANALCQVDAMLIEYNKEKIKKRIIIEIEVSSDAPTKICGKYFTTNLASSYIREDKTISLYTDEPGDKPGVIFLQIVDTNGATLQKKQQLENIAEAINLFIDAAEKAKAEQGCIKEYHLLPLDHEKDDIDKKIETFFKKIKVF
jgi:hypothetical protein